MVANLPAIYAEAWTAPRQSMRRILGLGLREQDRLIMVVLSLVLFAIPLVMILRSLPPVPQAGELTSGVILIACAVFISGGVLAYYAVAWLIKTLGARFGGKASLEDCRNVSAWSQLVTGIANFVAMLLTFMLPGAIGVAIRFAVSIAGLIIFSAYLAEAHGFSNVRRVLAVVFLFLIGLTLLLNMIVLSGVPQ